jgi:hypothetical protein
MRRKTDVSSKPEAPEPATTPPNYDVAISFLAKDEPIAAAINDGLASSLKVFFFPRNQEALAGTDGLESMRTPFLTESRVNVVLYRDQWGQTPWTRVEEAAIKDACLKRGWTSLFFVALDKSNALPVWLPETYVRFNFKDYGIEQAVGAIKARVQERGGTIARPNAAADAARIHREAQFLADRDRLFRDQQWIMDTVSPAVKATFETMDQIARDLMAQTGIRFQSGANDGQCVLRNNRVSLHLGWRQTYTNVIYEHAGFTATEYNAHIGLPVMYWREPPVLRQYKFKPALTLTRDICWIDEEDPNELLSPYDLADRCVRLFLDLVGRANRGEISAPDF